MAASPDNEVRPAMLLLAAAVGIAFWALGHLLPYGEGADPSASCMVLAVTASTTTCWLTRALPIGASSLLPIVLLPLAGAQPMPAVVRGYSSPILWLFGGGFVLAMAIEKWGLHRRLALSVVRAIGPHPRRLVLGFFLAAVAISLWINNTAVALMLLPIGWALVDRTLAAGELGGRAGRNFAAGVMLAIAYGASIGGMGTPIGTAPNALFFGNYQGLVDRGAPPLSFLQWLLAFLPLVLILTLLFSWLLTSFVLPVPRGRLAGGESLLSESRQLGRMTNPERRVALLFGFAVLSWVTRGDLRFGDGAVIRGWAWYLTPAGGSADYIHDGVVAVGIALLAFLIPAGDGTGARLMDWATVRRLPFEILFLLGAGIALADAFDPTGLSGAFGNLLAPLVGNVHPLLLIAVVVVVIALLSEVASNTAIAALFLPILGQGAVAANVDPRLLMLPATLAASCGFMLPIATPPNTIVFATGRVSIGQMAKAGMVLDLLAVLLLVLVLWTWVLPLLGIDPNVEPAWLHRPK